MKLIDVLLLVLLSLAISITIANDRTEEIINQLQNDTNRTVWVMAAIENNDSISCNDGTN